MSDSLHLLDEILVIDLGVGMARREDAEAMAAANPRLVVLEITGNPRRLEDQDLPSNELLAQASSGLCYEQFSARPLFMGFLSVRITAHPFSDRQ